LAFPWITFNVIFCSTKGCSSLKKSLNVFHNEKKTERFFGERKNGYFGIAAKIHLLETLFLRVTDVKGSSWSH